MSAQNGASLVKRKSYNLTRNKFLTESEQSQLVAVLDRSLRSPIGHRDALMLFTCLHTGGRATEILNLKAKDFDFQRHSIYLTGIKGSRDREVPIPKWLALEMRNFLRASQPDDLIFPISYNRMRQIWVYYRPTQKRMHCLRHTFAVNVYQKTNDVRLLQLALGHKSILNTMIYVDFFYSLNALRKLVE